MSPWITVCGPSCHKPLQLVAVGDVHLGEVDEGVAEAVAVMIEAVAQHRCAVVAAVAGPRHPRRLGGAPRGILETHVQLRQFVECALPRRRV